MSVSLYILEIYDPTMPDINLRFHSTGRYPAIVELHGASDAPAALEIDGVGVFGARHDEAESG